MEVSHRCFYRYGSESDDSDKSMVVQSPLHLGKSVLVPHSSMAAARKAASLLPPEVEDDRKDSVTVPHLPMPNNGKEVRSSEQLCGRVARGRTSLKKDSMHAVPMDCQQPCLRPQHAELPPNRESGSPSCCQPGF